MNAYKIMMFILLFSFSVTIVTGLHIYSSAGNVDPAGINFTDDGQVANYTSWDAIWNIIGHDLMLAIAGGIIAGSIAHWTAGVPGDKAFLYSSFVTFYLAKCTGAIQVFWAMGNATTNVDAKAAILVGVIIFSLVVAISLFSFLMQLIGGPWQSME